MSKINRILSVFIAVVLISASIGKLTGSVLKQFGRIDGLPEGPLTNIVIVMEFSLAVMLFSGKLSSLSWLLSLVIFLVFSFVSARAVYLGQSSCGCLGVVDIHPWIILSFDLGIVFLLVLFRPKTHDKSVVKKLVEEINEILIPASAILILLVCFVSLSIAYTGSLESFLSFIRGSSIVVIPSSLSYGQIELGSKNVKTIDVYNSGNSEIKLIGGTSDAFVTTTLDLPIKIPSKSKVTIRILLFGNASSGQFYKNAQLIFEKEKSIYFSIIKINALISS